MEGRRTGPGRVQLDDVARAIIEQLQEDGRRPYASIGKAVGLSEAAVRQRVQKLIDANIMQVVAVTDPLQTGFHRQAMVGINADGDQDEVASALADIAEIDYVVVTAGSFDIICEVLAIDDDHLLELMARIRAVPGVRSSEPFMYLRLKKQTYNWGAH
jgi:Lrp/AsnC family transcriptional regulator, regulator for asnA, asnC and gidA